MKCAQKNTFLNRTLHLNKSSSSLNMSNALPKHLQPIIDTICSAGCKKVNEIIEILDNDGHTEETVELSEKERRLVLHELRIIMSVYDEKD